MVAARRIFLEQASSKALQDYLFSVRVPGKEADAVAPAAKLCVNRVAPDPLSCGHLLVGVPQSGQNLAPGGTGLPQFGQKEALAILAPQERQNLEPAGTEAPQLGQMLCS